MAVEQFLERLSRDALEMRENGDVAGLNALTGDPAIRDYVNNVVFAETLTRSQFEYWYKNQYSHLKVLAEQYEQAEQNKARVNTLEEQLGDMKKMLSALLEVQTTKQKAAVVAAVEGKEDDAQAEHDEQPDESDEEADAPRADAQEGEPEEDETEAE